MTTSTVSEQNTPKCLGRSLNAETTGLSKPSFSPLPLKQRTLDRRGRVLPALKRTPSTILRWSARRRGYWTGNSVLKCCMGFFTRTGNALTLRGNGYPQAGFPSRTLSPRPLSDLATGECFKWAASLVRFPFCRSSRRNSPTVCLPTSWTRKTGLSSICTFRVSTTTKQSRRLSARSPTLTAWRLKNKRKQSAAVMTWILFRPTLPPTAGKQKTYSAICRAATKECFCSRCLS